MGYNRERNEGKKFCDTGSLILTYNSKFYLISLASGAELEHFDII